MSASGFTYLIKTKEKNLKNIKKVLAIIIVTAIIIVVFKPQIFLLKKIYKLEYSEYVYKYSQENELDPFLVFAIIKNESNFNQSIESSMGAIGLMQLMESTAVEIANTIGHEVATKEVLYNPEINIKIGTKYFAYLKEHYNGNEQLALTAYNAGMGNVDKWIKEEVIDEDGSDLENIPYKETNNYVRKIVRDYRIYKELWDVNRDVS